MSLKGQNVWRWGITSFLAAALVVLVSGCGGKTVLYTDLKEKDANEMMAILMSKGISCTKTAGKEGTWELDITSDDFTKAMELMQAEGYPPTAYQGLGQVFGQKGMVSSPSEERARFMYALSQSLAETIAQIDGVLTARVHVVLQETEPFSNQVRPASSSVFIKCRYDANIEAYIPQIKILVMNSIEGLSYDRVSVVIFRAGPPDIKAEGQVPSWQPQVQEMRKVLSIQVDAKSSTRLWLVISILVVLFIAAAAAAGFFFIQSLHKKETGAEETDLKNGNNHDKDLAEEPPLPEEEANRPTTSPKV